MFMTGGDQAYFEVTLERLAGVGLKPIALYGAGRVARQLNPASRSPQGLIAGIIDDDEAKVGKQWAGLPVIDFETAQRMGVKAVIITAEGEMQDRMWSRRGRFREAGMQVLCCPARFDSKTWDDCLIDQYEHMIAQSNGVERVYVHEYPKADAKAAEWLLNPIAGAMKDGDTVCEIGTGSGMWTEHLIDRAGAYYAVDYSARLLFEAMEHRFVKHLHKLHLIHDETATLAGVPDGSVDVLFSCDVFVHFKSDLVHQFLAAAKRVMKPGGQTFIHFNQWNDEAIRCWEKFQRDHHRGGMSIIYYNHIDWLRASGRRLELTAETAAEFGQGFLARFTHA